MAKMLVIEELRAVHESLAKTRHSVTTVARFEEAMHHLSGNKYDVIILDTEVNCALAHCANLRTSAENSAIVLICSPWVPDVVADILNAGADRLLSKPFDPRELRATVTAVLRRPRIGEAIPQHNIQIGNVLIHRDSAIVLVNNKVIELHAMEFKLLEFLACHQNQVFSSQALWTRLWYARSGKQDSVRTHMKTLRRKLCVDKESDIIRTISGRGYTISGSNSDLQF